MFNIRNYHKILKQYNIKEDEGHLLLPEEALITNNNRIKIVRDLFLCLGDIRAENPNFKLKKRIEHCKLKNCVSPQCFDFYVKPDDKITWLEKEDIEEIAETIDLKEVEALGIKKYLEEYNEVQPDIFKLSMSDFKIVLAYKKGL